jgi:hypothetical protein
VDEKEIKPYWVNTSANKLVKNIIQKGSGDLKKELEELLNGKSIRKIIDENIVFSQIEAYTTTLWNFLLFTGYLKHENSALEGEEKYCDLSLPNREITHIYKKIIKTWIPSNVLSIENYNLMLKSLVTGDIKSFRSLFVNFVLNSFSYFDISGDEPERFYHAFVLGVLVSLENNYQVKSNRESGYGRYDVMIIPRDKNRLGIIMELKKVDQFEDKTLEKAVDAALEQIENKKYETELKDLGINKVLKLGIAFEGKNVLVKEGTKK